MKAYGDWVQVKVVAPKSTFVVANSSLLEGTVISADNLSFKKGEKVLFPSVHGKVMEHSAAGEKQYFVHEDAILGYE